MARIGQFSTDIKSYGEYADKADYKAHAYSLSVEYGKTIKVNRERGTFIEPQVQFTAGVDPGSLNIMVEPAVECRLVVEYNGEQLHRPGRLGSRSKGQRRQE